MKQLLLFNIRGIRGATWLVINKEKFRNVRRKKKRGGADKPTDNQPTVSQTEKAITAEKLLSD